MNITTKIKIIDIIMIKKTINKMNTLNPRMKIQITMSGQTNKQNLKR